MIRIYLIDDHALVRTGFREVLKQQVDFDIIGEAETGEDGLKAIRELKPDVVLCDLHLPGISGFEVTTHVVQAQLPSKMIVLSAQVDGPMPQRLIDAGAYGYLSKHVETQELYRAIRDVARGKKVLSGDIAQQMALGKMTGEASPFDQLSPRELEISIALAQGKGMQDIAKTLHLSPKTVATHKYNAMEKLGISDVIALAKMAEQYGVVG